jgi:oxygen-dependent protoporphyrinogen oxidase
MAPPTRIAVIGGGLTGLSAAFHAARRFPRAQVVLFERNQRIGGWVRSHRVEVEAPAASGSENVKASILLECGPRTLRPAVDGSGRAVLELVRGSLCPICRLIEGDMQIHLLGLQEQLITTSTAAPAARNRFLHIPGRKGLHVVPSGLGGILKSPYLTSVLFSSSLREPFRRKNRGVRNCSVIARLQHMSDETLLQFRSDKSEQ